MKPAFNPFLSILGIDTPALEPIAHKITAKRQAMLDKVAKHFAGHEFSTKDVREFMYRSEAWARAAVQDMRESGRYTIKEAKGRGNSRLYRLDRLAFKSDLDHKRKELAKRTARQLAKAGKAEKFSTVDVCKILGLRHQSKTTVWRRVAALVDRGLARKLPRDGTPRTYFCLCD